MTGQALLLDTIRRVQRVHPRPLQPMVLDSITVNPRNKTAALAEVGAAIGRAPKGTTVVVVVNAWPLTPEVPTDE